MVNKPSSPIYSIVEKAYYRIQAGDVLSRCLEDGSMEALHETIQEMVIAGPQSLNALREILAEAVKRKTQVYDDLNQVTNQLAIILKGYGINLERQEGNQLLQSLTEQQLQQMLNDQNIVEPQTHSESLQVLRDSRELMAALNAKIHLLENIEIYLQDWLWGLTYQFIKHGDNEPREDLEKGELQ